MNPRVFDQVDYIARVQRVEAAMERAGLDALIAYSVRNQPGPVAYLAGYETSFGLHDVVFFVIAPGGRPRYALLTNAFWDQPQDLSWPSDIILTSDFEGKLVELLPNSLHRVGIAGYRFFPAPVYNALQVVFPTTRFEDATPLLKDVATIKSEKEIQVMREVARISEVGVRAFLTNVREGVHERSLVAEIERAMLEAGAEGLSFPTILMTGSRVVTSIGFAADRRLERGDQVNILCGARYQGYGDELARVTTIGKPEREVLEIMETAAEMHEAMQQMVHPGTAVADVANASIAVARKHGLDAYLFKSMNSPGVQGHGMGCWYDEPPPIHPGSNYILKPNMLVILESRLGKPRVGGAVITEPWVVTPHGGERLSKLDLRTWPGQ